jgi:hypothetical protein
LAARYCDRPPFAATSRDTADNERPRPAAIAVKVSPRSSPTRISSRSASDSRDAGGFHTPPSAGARPKTFITACLEHSTIRPISRRE